MQIIFKFTSNVCITCSGTNTACKMYHLECLVFVGLSYISIVTYTLHYGRWPWKQWNDYLKMHTCTYTWGSLILSFESDETISLQAKYRKNTYNYGLLMQWSVALNAWQCTGPTYNYSCLAAMRKGLVTLKQFLDCLWSVRAWLDHMLISILQRSRMPNCRAAIWLVYTHKKTAELARIKNV